VTIDPVEGTTDPSRERPDPAQEAGDGEGAARSKVWVAEDLGKRKRRAREGELGRL